jgi:hypothetical protein
MRECVSDRAGALQEHFVDLSRAGIERGIQLFGALVDRLDARLEIAEQLLAAFAERLLHAGEALVELVGQIGGGAAEDRDEMRRPRFERLGQLAARVFGLGAKIGDPRVDQIGENVVGTAHLAGEFLQARGERFVDRRAAIVEARDQRFTGIVDRDREIRGCILDAVADQVGGTRQLVLELFVGACNGCAQPFGVGDDPLALVAQIGEQRADANLVVGIGALEFGHLGLHQRFEFGGARDRAFDAFAHRGDFAPDGLADIDDAFLGEVFRFGEPQRDLAHRARGQAHFLRAAQQRSDAEEGGDRYDDADGDRDDARQVAQGLQRTDLPDFRRIKQVGERDAANRPQNTDDEGSDGGCDRRLAVQACDERCVVAFRVIVIRGLEADLSRCGTDAGIGLFRCCGRRCGRSGDRCSGRRGGRRGGRRHIVDLGGVHVRHRRLFPAVCFPRPIRLPPLLPGSRSRRATTRRRDRVHRRVRPLRLPPALLPYRVRCSQRSCLQPWPPSLTNQKPGSSAGSLPETQHKVGATVIVRAMRPRRIVTGQVYN